MRDLEVLIYYSRPVGSVIAARMLSVQEHMAMKKGDCEKHRAARPNSLKLESSERVDKRCTTTALDRREQRKVDQAKGLVPFACKLDREIVERPEERSTENWVGLTGLLTDIIPPALSADASHSELGIDAAARIRMSGLTGGIDGKAALRKLAGQIAGTLVANATRDAIEYLTAALETVRSGNVPNDGAARHTRLAQRSAVVADLLPGARARGRRLALVEYESPDNLALLLAR
ncbi:hypothetical protein [Paraburkholderia antibiotica]|uniref:hypothetical protein n=1 Tax=Paraburkholderia antibiotica TaxID=2728839 RepID=UPI00197F4A79|nr:hypothetical protein [Paraburkholderia antibiotica]